MAKKKVGTIIVRLVSTAGTGFFYTTKRNTKSVQRKLEFVKYDPRVNRRVLFTEQRIKKSK